MHTDALCIAFQHTSVGHTHTTHTHTHTHTHSVNVASGRRLSPVRFELRSELRRVARRLLRLDVTHDALVAADERRRIAPLVHHLPVPTISEEILFHSRENFSIVSPSILVNN